MLVGISTDEQLTEFFEALLRDYSELARSSPEQLKNRHAEIQDNATIRLVEITQAVSFLQLPIEEANCVPRTSSQGSLLRVTFPKILQTLSKVSKFTWSHLSLRGLRNARRRKPKSKPIR